MQTLNDISTILRHVEVYDQMIKCSIKNLPYLPLSACAVKQFPIQLNFKTDTCLEKYSGSISLHHRKATDNIDPSEYQYFKKSLDYIKDRFAMKWQTLPGIVNQARCALIVPKPHLRTKIIEKSHVLGHFQKEFTRNTEVGLLYLPTAAIKN
ncbi:hypothetical protein BpHYR1_010066 [Brachionus plicatilis]|uniref:Uncharacterized protein n=1 Tax=Brachionus plicatilis TaxID=10195 RepID=A0A3M7RD50_BRAPC|nr:hypothetical protein BpHYR1_010066 [Brachionus plicatilis]